jgi:hypothetical protein
MTTPDALLPATVLQRKAVVYVRQSTPQQVQSNLESQRRQYELVDVARRRGFTNVEIIDDDLGRSASGAVDRPGFDRLVAALCAGQVGAVLCLDASRLARNGRDWHHLLELCGLVLRPRAPQEVSGGEWPSTLQFTVHSRTTRAIVGTMAESLPARSSVLLPTRISHPMGPGSRSAGA